MKFTQLFLFAFTQIFDGSLAPASGVAAPYNSAQLAQVNARVMKGVLLTHDTRFFFLFSYCGSLRASPLPRDTEVLVKDGVRHTSNSLFETCWRSYHSYYLLFKRVQYSLLIRLYMLSRNFFRFFLSCYGHQSKVVFFSRRDSFMLRI